MTLTQVPDDMLPQCRCTYLENSILMTLEDLQTVEFGDWQAYMNANMAVLMKETKEKSVASFLPNLPRLTILARTPFQLLNFVMPPHPGDLSRRVIF